MADPSSQFLTRNDANSFVLRARTLSRCLSLAPYLSEQAWRQFREYETIRKQVTEYEEKFSPPRKTAAILVVDYEAVVAADVQRQRDSLCPVLC